jgi:hypothetical protein
MFHEADRFSVARLRMWAVDPFAMADRKRG